MSGRPNDGLFDFLDKLAAFVLANLLWVLLSIPIVTLPLTTAGLFAVMSRWAQGQPVEVFRDFFGGMRAHWRKASVIVVLDLLLGALIAADIYAFGRMDAPVPLILISRSVTLFVTVTAVMVNLYLWPLMVTFDDLPLRRLLDLALKLVFAHPLWSVVMLALALLPVVASLLLPAAALVMVSFSSIALLTSWSAWHIIRRYVSAKPEAEPN